MAKKIERKVADTILQRSRQIEVNGVLYDVAPPTVATLILVSALAAELPKLELNPDDILKESLFVAKDCQVLGDIVAVMILGAKNLVQVKQLKKKKWFGLWHVTTGVTINRQMELAENIRQNISPRQLSSIIGDLLVGMEISDFFGLTTSLISINLTRETREVGKTIQSGRS